MPSPISFIIPALNEEAALTPMLDGLRAALDAAACADADIIVVDNGSRDTNFGWTIEMQIKAHRLGLNVVEIPVNYRNRIAGESKISGTLAGTVRAGWRILWTIAKYGVLSS